MRSSKSAKPSLGGGCVGSVMVGVIITGGEVKVCDEEDMETDSIGIEDERGGCGDMESEEVLGVKLSKMVVMVRIVLMIL